MIVSCSWCHEAQDLDESRYCGVCGHRADRARVDCDCAQCQADFSRYLARDPDAIDPDVCAVCGKRKINGECPDDRALGGPPRTGDFNGDR